LLSRRQAPATSKSRQMIDILKLAVPHFGLIFFALRAARRETG
jgi:hypothetical protein